MLLAFLHQHIVAPVTPEIATLAATMRARHQLGMADAQARNTTLWTQDDDSKDLPRVRYPPKPKPL